MTVMATWTVRVWGVLLCMVKCAILVVVLLLLSLLLLLCLLLLLLHQ